MSRNNLNLLRKCKGARSKDTRVRAPNEPRIIVARPSTTHPSLIAEISSLSANAIAKGGRADTGRLFAPRVRARVYSEASASALCRFATPEDNRRTTRYRSRVSRDVDYACRAISKGSETRRSVAYALRHNVQDDFAKDRASVSRWKKEKGEFRSKTKAFSP